MQSTLTTQNTDPHDIFVIEPDVVLAARAGQLPAGVSPGSPAGAPVPAVDTTFRAAANDDIRIAAAPSSRSGWAGRVAIAFLFALCSAVAAAAWQHYGDTATRMIANWTPPFALTSSPPAAPGAAGQPNAPAVQTAAADQAATPAAQPAANAASTGTTAAAPATAAAAPDTTPSLQSVAQDLAAMGQQIETLKATIEQLKTGQEQMAQQMARDLARKPQVRTAEPNPHPKLSALPPRPATPPARKPAPAFSPAMAATAIRTSPPPVAPYAPPQSSAAPMPYESRAQAIDRADGDPVDRPPMPVH